MLQDIDHCGAVCLLHSSVSDTASKGPSLKSCKVLLYSCTLVVHPTSHLRLTAVLHTGVKNASLAGWPGQAAGPVVCRQVETTKLVHTAIEVLLQQASTRKVRHPMQ